MLFRGDDGWRNSYAMVSSVVMAENSTRSATYYFAQNTHMHMFVLNTSYEAMM